jgi:hypothetical protein
MSDRVSGFTANSSFQDISLHLRMMQKPLCRKDMFNLHVSCSLRTSRYISLEGVH